MTRGDPYYIIAADGSFLTPQIVKKGLPQGTVILTDPTSNAGRGFAFIRQGDGSYALAIGTNYVTALGGGGKVQTYVKGSLSTIFHTDATQVQAWEKFRLIDQGNCTYAIQTVSGFYVGIYKDSSGRTLLTTRQDGVKTENVKFQFVMMRMNEPWCQVKTRIDSAGCSRCAVRICSRYP